MNGPKKYGVELAVPARAELGEGPVWDTGSQTMFWVDILVGHLHRYWPDNGVDVAVDVGSAVSAVGLREAGGLILALQDSVALVGAGDVAGALSRPENAGAYARLAAREQLPIERLSAPQIDAEHVRFNDAAVDPEGRFLAGTMDWREQAPVGTLYQIGRDRAVTEVLEPVTVSNGIDITDDRRTMYYIDSALAAVTSYDRDPDTGLLRDPKRIINVPAAEGEPDGLTLDAEGFLWVAIWGAGEVRRYTPDGQLVAVVEVPARQVTSACFGGKNLGELFITTARIGLDQVELAGSPLAGDVFWCDTGTTGRPAARFAG